MPVNGKYSDEATLVQNTSIPVAFVIGAHEPFLNKDYVKSTMGAKFWRNQVQELDNAGHCPPLEVAADFNRLLKDFVQEVL